MLESTRFGWTVLDDGRASLGLGAEPAAVEQLAFEAREETLAHGDVGGVADRAAGATSWWASPGPATQRAPSEPLP